MITWPKVNRYQRFFAVIVICFTFAATFIRYKTSRTNPNEGWKTSKELSRPFENSVITNGQEPAYFEARLVYPKQNMDVRCKEIEEIAVQVQVKFSDGMSVNSDIAPSSVVALIRSGKKLIASKALDPHKRGDLEFIYKGISRVPIERGDYRMEIEVNYSIYDLDANRSTGEGVGIMISPKTHRKVLEGVKIHVGN